jgi:hypothetical protein
MEFPTPNALLLGLLLVLAIFAALYLKPRLVSLLYPDKFAPAKTADAELAGKTVTGGDAKTVPKKESALMSRLSSKGWTMYGNDRCPLCADQLSVLGIEFDGVRAINCSVPEFREAGKRAGVTRYPTWVHSSGETRVGFRPYDELVGW